MDDSESSMLTSEAELRSLMGDAMELSVQKIRPTLDKHSKAFIARSPFLCLGTSNAEGKTDVSPRGDPPGFVQVMDDNTLFIPDRPGNRRFDSMSNIAQNPEVGLLFFIPGFEDTLRINGTATLVQDQDLLDAATVNGKAPTVGIRIVVQEAFLHCAKALKRSRLWDPDAQQDRKEMPSLAKMILEQVAEPENQPTSEEIQDADAFVEDNYKTELY